MRLFQGKSYEGERQCSKDRICGMRSAIKNDNKKRGGRGVRNMRNPGKAVTLKGRETIFLLSLLSFEKIKNSL